MSRSMVHSIHCWYVTPCLSASQVSFSLEYQSQAQPQQYYSTPAIVRYFDHIQSIPSVLNAVKLAAPEFSFVTFDFDSAPKVERKTELPKRKEKAPKPSEQQQEHKHSAQQPTETMTSPQVERSSVDPGSQKRPNEGKEKKKDASATEGGKKKGNASTASKAPKDDGEPVPSMIDMRVGHIIDGVSHVRILCVFN